MVLASACRVSNTLAWEEVWASKLSTIHVRMHSCMDEPPVKNPFEEHLVRTLKGAVMGTALDRSSASSTLGLNKV